MKGLAHWIRATLASLRDASPLPLTRGDAALADIMRQCCRAIVGKGKGKHATR